MMALAQPSLNSEGATAPLCREKSLYYFIVLLTGSCSDFAQPLFSHLFSAARKRAFLPWRVAVTHSEMVRIRACALTNSEAGLAELCGIALNLFAFGVACEDEGERTVAGDVAGGAEGILKCEDGEDESRAGGIEA